MLLRRVRRQVINTCGFFLFVYTMPYWCWAVRSPVTSNLMTVRFINPTEYENSHLCGEGGTLNLSPGGEWKERWPHACVCISLFTSMGVTKTAEHIQEKRTLPSRCLWHVYRISSAGLQIEIRTQKFTSIGTLDLSRNKSTDKICTNWCGFYIVDPLWNLPLWTYP